MSLKHVSEHLPDPIIDACKETKVEYSNVPIDGKTHKVSLVGDKSGQKLGYIKRAVGGVCGQVFNKKTGQSVLFTSLPGVDL